MGSRDLCGCLPSGIETEVCANGLSSLAEAILKKWQWMDPMRKKSPRVLRSGFVKTDGKKSRGRFMSPIKNEEDYTPQD